MMANNCQKQLGLGQLQLTSLYNENETTGYISSLNAFKLTIRTRQKLQVQTETQPKRELLEFLSLVQVRHGPNGQWFNGWVCEEVKGDKVKVKFFDDKKKLRTKSFTKLEDGKINKTKRYDDDTKRYKKNIDQIDTKQAKLIVLTKESEEENEESDFKVKKLNGKKLGEFITFQILCLRGLVDNIFEKTQILQFENQIKKVNDFCKKSPGKQGEQNSESLDLLKQIEQNTEINRLFDIGYEQLMKPTDDETTGKKIDTLFELKQIRDQLKNEVKKKQMRQNNSPADDEKDEELEVKSSAEDGNNESDEQADSRTGYTSNEFKDRGRFFLGQRDSFQGLKGKSSDSKENIIISGTIEENQTDLPLSRGEKSERVNSTEIHKGVTQRFEKSKDQQDVVQKSRTKWQGFQEKQEKDKAAELRKQEQIKRAEKKKQEEDSKTETKRVEEQEKQKAQERRKQVRQNEEQKKQRQQEEDEKQLKKRQEEESKRIKREEEALKQENLKKEEENEKAKLRIQEEQFKRDEKQRKEAEEEQSKQVEVKAQNEEKQKQRQEKQVKQLRKQEGSDEGASSGESTTEIQKAQEHEDEVAQGAQSFQQSDNADSDPSSNDIIKTIGSEERQFDIDINAGNNKELKVKVTGSETVNELKEKIRDLAKDKKWFEQKAKQRLIYESELKEGDKTLSYYGINQDSNETKVIKVHLVFQLCGEDETKTDESIEHRQFQIFDQRQNFVDSTARESEVTRNDPDDGQNDHIYQRQFNIDSQPLLGGKAKQQDDWWPYYMCIQIQIYLILFGWLLDDSKKDANKLVLVLILGIFFLLVILAYVISHYY